MRWCCGGTQCKHTQLACCWGFVTLRCPCNHKIAVCVTSFQHLHHSPAATKQAGPAAGSSRQLIERRRQHGSVAHKLLDVVVNLFRLNVSRKTLYHYDVSFERQRSSSSSAPAQGAGGCGRRAFAAALSSVAVPAVTDPQQLFLSQLLALLCSRM